MLSLSTKCARSRKSLEYKPVLESLERREVLDASTSVRALYNDILHRTPSDAEVNGWVSRIQSGMSPTAVVNAFVTCDELYKNYVDSFYTNLLHRAPDAAGEAAWIGQFKRGMTFEEVKAHVLGTDEYFNLNGGTNRSWVAGVYRDTLGRGPDQGGSDFWTNQADMMMNREDLARQFEHSQEGETVLIQSLYSQILHRTGDSGGVSFWVQQMNQSAQAPPGEPGMVYLQIMAAFATSPEYTNAHGGWSTESTTNA